MASSTTIAPVSEAGPSALLLPPPKRRYWIDDWRPEDPVFWSDTGERVARRNLLCSIFSEHIGFSVWSLWSVFVLFLGPDYGFDPGQKFLLTTIPVAVGSVLRLPYTFAVARFGGRNWTIFSAAILVVPCVLAALVLRPGVSFGAMAAVAAVAGVGGGNFSSSMANIDVFYPQRLKGWALGLNAGGGNIGVAAAQLMGLAVLASAGRGHPRVLLGIYIPLIVLAAGCAALFMDNISYVRNDRGALRLISRNKHTWIVCLLYIGTFGSFIGFGFAFGQVLQVQFKTDFATPVRAAQLTFLGPLLGSLIRPIGGRLADRLSGSAVTFWNFLAMGAGALVVFIASQRNSLLLFVIGFVSLFVLSGVGNGSTYKMIPAIFRAEARGRVADGVDEAEASRRAQRSTRALIGLAGAVGAFGGVLVNLAFRQSFLTYHSGDAAYLAFVGLYLLCALTTWFVYRRQHAARLQGV